MERCKFMFNFVADAEATAERNFRTGILAGAGNKPSTGRTGNIVGRDDATRRDADSKLHRRVEPATLCPVCPKKGETTGLWAEPRKLWGCKKRWIGARRGGAGLKEEDRGAINTIGIEYRKAQRGKERGRGRERNFRGTKGSVWHGRI